MTTLMGTAICWVLGEGEMIPKRVIDYWREQGRSEEWIFDKQKVFFNDLGPKNNKPKQIMIFKQYIHSELPSIDALLAMYKGGKTLREIGDMFGYSWERIRQLIKSHPDYKTGTRTKSRNQEIRKLYWADGISTKELMKRFDLSNSRIRAILDLKYQPKEIGCDNCKTNQYARGLCKACYQLWISRGKPDNKRVKKKEKPGPKIKAIGCEECKANPYCRGLCRNCYGRWRYHGKPNIDKFNKKS